eukprot:1832358-Karenia_brevis.AAC.1
MQDAHNMYANTIADVIALATQPCLNNEMTWVATKSKLTKIQNGCNSDFSCIQTKLHPPRPPGHDILCKSISDMFVGANRWCKSKLATLGAVIAKDGPHVGMVQIYVNPIKRE